MIVLMDASIDVADYQRYCGPAALAAVLAVSRMTAAHLLLGVQRHRGLVTAPNTESADLALALDVCGVDVERFDTASGALAEPALECIDRACRALPINPAPKSAAHLVIDASPAESRPRLWEHFRNRHANKLRLSDWLLMAGTWLVLVDEDPDREMHWLALRDCRVVSDDDARYRDCRVVTALRLITRGDA